ncbi:TEX2 protein, partial [Fregetta grallaria]|nr:TEX2 protein [Fregetta grallaria]
QGWMNQLHIYDPELFHPSLTHSVLATLDGATLKLSYPKSNIPRRATFEEEILDTVFVSHRCYDLTDAKVFLCPPSLARKRTWNKKYPICVLLPDLADVECGRSEEHDAELQRNEGTKKALVPGQDVPGDCRERCLYLFGRTGREKEEWYQHLVRASRRTPSSSRGEARAGEEQPSWPLPCAGTDPGWELHMCREDKPQVGSSERGGRWRSPEPRAFAAAGRAWRIPLASVGWVACHWHHGRAACHRMCIAARHRACIMARRHVICRAILTRSCLCVPRRGTGSAEQQQQQWRERRGHPLHWAVWGLRHRGYGEMLGEARCYASTGVWGRFPQEGTHRHPGRHGSPSQGTSVPAGAVADGWGMPKPSTGLGLTPLLSCGSLRFSHVSGNSTSRKILRFVDKIAKSKYFQKATENEFIKKKIEEVSNTPLLLTVEVQELAGTLAVNIPPPPTDRVWYSFRVPPQLELKVRPKLGEREVTFLHVTEWIEKKLQHEFQKILVMPNMDDLIIPIMRSGLDP